MFERKNASRLNKYKQYKEIMTSNSEYTAKNSLIDKHI